MAAETLTSPQAAAAKPVFQPVGAGYVCRGWGSYAVAANVEDGDIFEMYRLPKNAEVFAGIVYAEDMDTDATETLDMDPGWADNGTDAADPDGFGDFGVWVGDAITDLLPVAGIYRPYINIIQSAGFKKFAAETVVQIEANAVSATFAAGQMSTYGLYVVN